MIEASELEDFFSGLSEYYVVSEPGEHYIYDQEDDAAIFGDTGQPLYELIQEWNIFSDDIVDSIPDLLEELWPGYDPTSSYTSRDLWYTEPDKAFRHFAHQLMFVRRFFPKETHSSDDTDLDRLLGPHLDELAITTKVETWLRARKHDRGLTQKEPIVFSENEMGCPPADRVSRGMRANPAGISYLYLASDLQTVVAEVRPVPGDYLSVGTFSIRKDLRIIDLARTLPSLDPIGSKDLRADIERSEIMREFGIWLSKPVREEDHEVDYVPTQYIAEYILHKGYHGIRYPSALGRGHNLVLFDQKVAKCRSVELHHIKSLNVTYTLGPPARPISKIVPPK